MQQSGNTITFDEFLEATELEDVMAAGFFYRIFLNSGLTINEWLESKD